MGAGYPLGRRLHSLAVNFSNTGPTAQSSRYDSKPKRLGKQDRVEEGRPGKNRNCIKTVLPKCLGAGTYILGEGRKQREWMGASWLQNSGLLL